MTKSIWAVTYWGEKEEPTVTAFDNEDNARKAYEYFKEKHEHCAIDYIPIYETFHNN